MEIFEFEPRYEYQTVSGYKVLISQFESGKEQRRYKRRLPREWELSFIGTPEEIEEIERFFCRHKGPAVTFLWAPEEEESAVCVRFKDEKLTVRGYGEHAKECSLTLVEVM